MLDELRQKSQVTIKKGMKKCNFEIQIFIEEMLNRGYSKFVIFPFGEIGMKVKHFLNVAYGIQEEYVLDNHLCQYNNQIKPLSYMAEIDSGAYAVLLSSTNYEIYNELYERISSYFLPDQIAELPSMKNKRRSVSSVFYTKIGKYSYGPICRNHPLIESIGAFCSFAGGRCCP